MTGRYSGPSYSLLQRPGGWAARFRTRGGIDVECWSKTREEAAWLAEEAIADLQKGRAA